MPERLKCRQPSWSSGKVQAGFDSEECLAGHCTYSSSVRCMGASVPVRVFGFRMSFFTHLPALWCGAATYRSRHERAKTVQRPRSRISGAQAHHTIPFCWMEEERED